VRALRQIPAGVDAVVIDTRPAHAEETLRECAELGIRHVWMHRGPGEGSVSPSAAAYGRAHGIAVIDGGCPWMFGPTADLGQPAMCLLLRLTGHVPRLGVSAR
jgi:predicted CoA-binding protein